MKDLETKARFVELRASGVSFGRIAKELQISKKTAIAWSEDFGPEIERRRAEIWDELQERYHVSGVQRAERLARQLESIESWIGECDASSMSPRDLWKLFLQYEKRIAVVSKECEGETEADVSTREGSSDARVVVLTDGAETEPPQEESSGSLAVLVDSQPTNFVSSEQICSSGPVSN